MIRPLHKYIRHAMLTLLSAFIALMAQAQQPSISPKADSLLHVIPTLQGTAMLDAYDELCHLDEIYFDERYANPMVENYIAACSAQKNYEREAYARQMRIFIHFNYDRVTEMEKLFTDDSTFLVHHNMWDNLFTEWAQLSEMYITISKPGKAQRTTNHMYEMARHLDNKIGLGMTSYNFGLIYQWLSNDSLAAKWLTQAVHELADYKDYSAYHYACDRLAKVLLNQKKYTEAKRLTFDWRKNLKARNAKSRFHKSNFYIYNCDIDLQEANADIGLGNLSSAELIVKRLVGADSTMTNVQQSVGLCVVRTALYMKRHQWQEAYNCLTPILQSTWEKEDGYSRLSMLVTQGECLMHLRRFEEAANAFHSYAQQSDSLRTIEVAQQLSVMQSVYDVDEYKLQTKVARQRSIIIIIVIATLLVLTGLIIFLLQGRGWSRRLELKNKQLERERNHVVAQNKQLAIERDRAESALRAKTSFMQNMTHEIRTPLNAISGFSQLLSTPGLDMTPEQLEEYNGYIVQNTNQLTNIVDNILWITDLESNTEVSKSDSCQPVNVCRTALQQVEPRLQPSVAIESDLATIDDAFTLPVKANHLQVIVDRLLDNAAKFTTSGSIRLTLATTADSLVLSVADTGPGIPADQQEAVFERFIKLDAFIPGAGLGLNVARLMATRMGATLTFDTSYSPGTKIDLTIPLPEA